MKQYVEEVVLVVLGVDLALVEALVCVPDVDYYQTPFGRSLVVFDRHPLVRYECKQTDSHRVDVTNTPPRHLHTPTYLILIIIVNILNNGLFSAFNASILLHSRVHFTPAEFSDGTFSKIYK